MNEPVVDINSRDSLINWLCWNDKNGCYTDEQSDMEDMPRLTLEEAQEIYHEQSQNG
jgi:hypothetical protein